MIRIAHIEDLKDIIALEKIYCIERQAMLSPEFRDNDKTMPEQQIRAKLTNKDYRTFIADMDNTVVGYMTVAIGTSIIPGKTHTEGRICDIYVCPEFRKQGIATEMYKHACQWFKEKHCTAHRLTAYPTNPAIKLYEKWGFKAFSVNMRKQV